jgi:hypothetical protein
VAQPQGWTGFIENDNTFLAFCLTARDSGIAGSKRAKITDEVVAMDLDIAVTTRLVQFDMEVRKANAQLIAYETVKLAFGTKDDDEDSSAEKW